MKYSWSIYIFLNSANLICRGRDISKYSRECLWHRDIAKVNCMCSRDGYSCSFAFPLCRQRSAKFSSFSPCISSNDLSDCKGFHDTYPSLTWTLMSRLAPIVSEFVFFMLLFLSLHVALFVYLIHYENMPIQIYWKFYHQKMKIFR